ncbi:hypothetical protein [Nocardia testacea]|uniref:hypothetical protein n=1 Tax=Nocardia testacea TaxID=248551 RepID=UPI0033EAE10B
MDRPVGDPAVSDLHDGVDELRTKTSYSGRLDHACHFSTISSVIRQSVSFDTDAP